MMENVSIVTATFIAIKATSFQFRLLFYILRNSNPHLKVGIFLFKQIAAFIQPGLISITYKIKSKSIFQSDHQ